MARSANMTKQFSSFPIYLFHIIALTDICVYSGAR